MLAWLGLGVLFGVPFVGCLGAAAVDADRQIGRPVRAAWWLVAWGLGMMAHWAPVAVWPMVLFAAAFLEPHRFEEHSVDALWPMGSLLGIGLGLAALQLGRRRLAKPVEYVVTAADRPARGSIWCGVTIAWASALLSIVWGIFLIEVGWQTGGLPWLATWAFAVCALATTFGGWLVTIGASTDDALRATGIALFGQAALPFLIALLPVLGRDPELQYAYLASTVAIATTGTFLWGWARPLPVGLTTASGSAG